MFEVSLLMLIGLGLLATFSGFLVGLLLFRVTAAKKIESARERADLLLDEARREADLTRKSAALEIREEGLREKERFENKTREIRKDIEKRTSTLHELDNRLTREAEKLKSQEDLIDRNRREVKEVRRRLEERQNDLEQLIEEQTKRLERISGLSCAEARRDLRKNLEDEARGEAARLAKRLREDTVRDADRQARRLVVMAAQRLAAEQSIESTVTVVPLPNDEMKGRIIGREGRNIRAFEMASGVDVIIDDTPEAVLLSAFDPVRREIARIAMENLITDGRIHPGRIEDVVAKVATEIEQEIREVGERSAIELSVHGLAPELAERLGRLRYRTSSGQSVLKHSIEVARLSEMIAAELGFDHETAKRAGLLHDIGKALDQQHEGPHALIGMEFVRRHGENEDVSEAVGGHHGEIETDAVLPILISAADAISGARPGARRESLEMYVKRLKKLEELADSFEGVERSFAIQAGREVRILVQHQAVTDSGATGMATEIARRIEKELQYPGQIKVVVIREMRVVDYAR